MAKADEHALVTVVDALPTISPAAKPGLLRGLSYLLGGLSTYLGAWLRRPVQAVEDRTDARTMITRAIAQAAADQLASDPNTISAAIAQWGPADLSRQVNKMGIAKNVIRELSDQSVQPGNDDEPSAPPNDDFFNSFERFCADSSDERMQDLWGRLLAGEIRKPGSFSRHTMRCLYELDGEVAKTFEKVAYRTIGHVFLCQDDKEITNTDINELQTAGLITGAGGVYNYAFKFNEAGIAMMKANRYVMAIKKLDSGKDFTVTSYPLSQAGIELMSLLPDYDERSAIIKLLDQIPEKQAPFIQISPFSEVDGKANVGSTEIIRSPKVAE